MDRAIDPHLIRRRQITRLAGGLTLLVCLGLLGALGMRWLRPSINRSQHRFAHVERGDIQASLRASGSVIAASERVVASPLNGRVLKVLHGPGAILKAGEPLFSLDLSASQLELAELDEEIAQKVNAQRQLDLELNKTLDGLKRRIELQGIDEEMASYRLAQAERLHEEGLVSAEDLKEAGIAIRRARIGRGQLNDEVGAERASHAARRELLALDSSILARRRADLVGRLERADGSQHDGGVLTFIVEEVGSPLTQGQVIAKIADLQSFRVEASVSDIHAAQLTEGQRAEVVVGGERLVASVSSVNPSIANGAVSFFLSLEDASHPGLRHGLRADVLVITGTATDVLNIPRGPYLVGAGDELKVFVVKQDRVVRHDVHLGLSGHDSVEALDGLELGDEIVISDMRGWVQVEWLKLR